MAEGNGHYDRFKLDLKELADRQENLVTRAIDELKNVMHIGHTEIADEIRKIREVGSLPLPLVEKLIDNINLSNSKNTDKVYKILIIMLVALLGLKSFMPHILGG